MTDKIDVEAIKKQNDAIRENVLKEETKPEAPKEQKPARDYKAIAKNAAGNILGVTGTMASAIGVVGALVIMANTVSLYVGINAAWTMMGLMLLGMLLLPVARHLITDSWMDKLTPA